MNQRRILVAYDGTEEAYWALMHAADAARANDAAIGVVTVLPALATAAQDAARSCRSTNSRPTCTRRSETRRPRLLGSPRSMPMTRSTSGVVRMEPWPGRSNRAFPKASSTRRPARPSSRDNGCASRSDAGPLETRRMTASRSRFLPVIVLALFLVGCASPGAPAWTFGPTLAPSGGTTGAEPSAAAERASASFDRVGCPSSKLCGQARHRGLRSRVQAVGRHRRRGGHLRGHLQQHGCHPA